MVVAGRAAVCLAGVKGVYPRAVGGGLGPEAQLVGDPHLDDLLAGVAVARVEEGPGLCVALGVNARLEDVVVGKLALCD